MRVRSELKSRILNKCLTCYGNYFFLYACKHKTLECTPPSDDLPYLHPKTNVYTAKDQLITILTDKCLKCEYALKAKKKCSESCGNGKNIRIVDDKWTCKNCFAPVIVKEKKREYSYFNETGYGTNRIDWTDSFWECPDCENKGVSSDNHSVSDANYYSNEERLARPELVNRV